MRKPRSTPRTAIPVKELFAAFYMCIFICMNSNKICAFNKPYAYKITCTVHNM